MPMLMPILMTDDWYWVTQYCCTLVLRLDGSIPAAGPVWHQLRVTQYQSSVIRVTTAVKGFALGAMD